MDYKNALKKFGNYYLSRYDTEFPMIFSMCDFKGKSVLEIGSGNEGHFLKELTKYTDKIVATDISKEILDDLRKNVSIKTKVCKGEKLPFENRTFDIVFCRWVLSYFNNLKKGIDEMCRVAAESVLLVFPSEEDDETKMLKIKFKDRYEMRKQRVKNIKKWLSENGFAVKEKRKTLKFLFPSVDEAVKIMSAMGFQNKLTKKEKEKLWRFFENRKTKKGLLFRQGAAFICATRNN